MRMGVHVGDVIVEGEDRHGDGVNIAARLQELVEPGGIAASQTIVNHVSNKVDLQFAAIGEHRVKNIARPVRAHLVRLEGSDVAERPPVFCSSQRARSMPGPACLADRRTREGNRAWRGIASPSTKQARRLSS
jgi:adenylate cyclase